MTACPECGFDPDVTDEAGVLGALATFPRRFLPPVTRFLPGEDGAAIVRARSSPDVWSALEYVAHTRDSIGWYHERIDRILAEDRPRLEPRAWVADGYVDEDPAEAAAGVGRAAAALAERLAALDGDGWARIGIGSDGGERTVLALARRAVHEGNHHLLDVGRSLRAARQR